MTNTVLISFIKLCEFVLYLSMTVRLYLISGRYIPNAVTYCTLSNIPPLLSGKNGILVTPECAGSLNYTKIYTNEYIGQIQSKQVSCNTRQKIPRSVNRGETDNTISKKTYNFIIIVCIMAYNV